MLDGLASYYSSEIGESELDAISKDVLPISDSESESCATGMPAIGQVALLDASVKASFPRLPDPDRQVALGPGERRDPSLARNRRRSQAALIFATSRASSACRFELVFVKIDFSRVRADS